MKRTLLTAGLLLLTAAVAAGCNTAVLTPAAPDPATTLSTEAVTTRTSAATEAPATTTEAPATTTEAPATTTEAPATTTEEPTTAGETTTTAKRTHRTAAPTTAAPTTAAPTTAVPATPPTAPVQREGRTYTADGHYIQTAAPSWELVLVNPWNPLPEDYVYGAEAVQYDSNKEFDQKAIDSLRAMIKAGKSCGLWAVSLYRPYELQVKLFNRKVNQMKSAGYKGAEAEAKAATVVARPGTSEHHTGLAADILGSGYSSLDQSFEKTAAFRWLKEHCAEYGFILRYTKETEPITGVIYEPWHYRYVGVEAATEIMARGITLEEYLEEKGW